MKGIVPTAQLKQLQPMVRRLRTNGEEIGWQWKARQSGSPTNVDRGSNGDRTLILRRSLEKQVKLVALPVRRERRRFPVGESPTRQTLQPEATGAGMEETKCLKPLDRAVTTW